MSKPIRMCISCKKRLYQDSLTRLQFYQNSLTLHKGGGRSFYICSDCASLDIKSIIKSFKRVCRSNVSDEKLSQQIKEILVNG